MAKDQGDDTATHDGATAQSVAGGTAEGSDVPVRETIAKVEVLYCQVCKMPVEYCEFGTSLQKCKTWLEDEHPDEFERLYSEEGITSKLGTMTVEQQEKLDKEAAKKEAKANAKAEKDLEKKMSSIVKIKLIERTKRKRVTTIFGLEAFDVDLKKAAKQFAQKFATAASVTKNASGQNEIVINGEVSDEVEEMLIDKFGVPEDNIDFVEEKSKKKAV